MSGSILFLGGPADGDRLAVPWNPYHGRSIEIVERQPVRLLDHPSPETEPFVRHVYRCVEFNCDGTRAFAAIPTNKPDSFALTKLIEGYQR